MAGVGSLLPTIKCSSCGRQVEISMMGEHICSGADAEPEPEEPEPAPAPAPAPAAPASPSFFGKLSSYTYGSKPSTNSRDQERAGRVPPQVDTSAANRNFYRGGLSTPVSTSSSSQSVSPLTPLGTRNGAGGRLGDDYFSPSIAGEFDSPSSPQRRPGGYGGLGSADEADSYHQPANSPKPSPNLMERMESIAPGPFDVGRRPSNTPSTSASRTGGGSSGSNGSSSNNSSNSNDFGYGSDRYGNSTSDNLPSPRGQRQNGYGGFESSPQSNTRQNDGDFEAPNFARAGTFPRLRESNDSVARTPSAPGYRPDRRRQAASSSANDYYSSGSSSGSNRISSRMGNPGHRSNRPSMGPDTSRLPPPRTSLVRPRTSGRDSNASHINLAAEFGIGNPYHSPTVSMSSTVSSLDQPSIPFSSSQSSLSSASSFSTSASVHNNNNKAADRMRPQAARKNSNVAQLDSLLDDIQSLSSTTRDERDMPARAAAPPPDRKMGSLRTARRPSARDAQDNNNARSQAPAFDADNDDDRRDRFDRSATSTPLSLRIGVSPDRRPISRGRDRDYDRDNNYDRDHDHDYDHDHIRERSRARDRSAARTKPTQPTPPTQPAFSRGRCKACGELITGKSVSSADGRLTGRYHKACFVCTTCAKPFASATFYVHDDQPYCEHHYHEINGSLCGTCGFGIEGRYLADETDQKHHETCFVCADCRLPLRDGYFEVSGQIYCERDAWRRVQQTMPPPPPPVQAPVPMHHQADRRQPPRGRPGPPRGLPAGPGSRLGPGRMPPPTRPYGLPNPNGSRLGPGPRPRMEKRMTRLGIM